MAFIKKFIKLMKSELTGNNAKKHNHQWIIDESKCLNAEEVRRLRNFCIRMKNHGLRNNKFSYIRNWFMAELGLNAGLRVEEMASLRCADLLIDRNRSSIIVTGKGQKKRSVWISSSFKEMCQIYLDYKRKFGYSTEQEDYLLNNLKGKKITKRALQKFFKNIIKKASLSERHSIHHLRHTYSTFLLKASNNNYRFLQQQLGHASIRTTQTYAGIIESEGRKAVERLFR